MAAIEDTPTHRLERLKVAVDTARKTHEDMHQRWRATATRVQQIQARTELTGRAKGDMKNKIRAAAVLAQEPVYVAAQEAVANALAPEFAGAFEPLQYDRSSHFTEPGRMPTLVPLTEQQLAEKSTSEVLMENSTAARWAAELSRTPLSDLKTLTLEASDAGRYAQRGAALRETSLRAETSVEARRLLVELKRLAELNPAPEVTEGQALLGELKMFGRAQTQSHFALKSGFVDESMGQVAGFREERLAGRSGSHWYMTSDSLGVHSLRNVHGRKLGENPPVAIPDQVAVADEAAGVSTVSLSSTFDRRR